ncbi:MAG: deoxyribodipyrimidine photo-lyase [Bacteroidales bacterium]
MSLVQASRTRLLHPGHPTGGPVVYWMSRDQRVQDNWALLRAQQEAIGSQQPLLVVFTLFPNYPGATLRAYDFMLRGLEEIANEFLQLNIPFILLTGEPTKTLPAFLRECKAGILFTDFDPLRIKRHWKEKIISQLSIPVYETDAHNIVPCFVASDKQEFGAYTLRPKIKRLLAEYLDPFPALMKMQKSNAFSDSIAWQEVESKLRLNRDVPAVTNLKPGSLAANRQLQLFISKRLDRYATERNDPNLDACSGLSPWLHFGHIAAQRVVMEVIRQVPVSESTEAFLEELIVRRELSDNYCYYNLHYDTPKGFPAWASKEHGEHARDEREYIYSPEEFDSGKTHDPLWNAAQLQMVKTGYMHGYMRMYWAKKILEWTPSVEEAQSTAIYLNDTWQLDGRDPNGYTGIAWSLGGVHDRAWSSRPVYGKIRYMNANGCRRKFNVDAYLEQVQKL